MHILITTSVFAANTGSDSVVEDLLGPLLARGHRVTVFWPRAAGRYAHPHVPVISDPGDLDGPPDIIHGQHVNAILPVTMRFPGTPVIQSIQDVTHPIDEPLRLPSIRHYIAVDALRARRALDAGVAPDRITIVPNAVALDRFPAKPPHDRIARVLVVVKYHQAFGELARRALENRDVTITCIGAHAGGMRTDFAALLAEHDMLVGSGRCVLEAAATGLNAIVCDERGFAGALTRESLARLREGNFGLAVFDGPTSPDRIAAAFRKLDPAEAPGLRDILRREAPIDGTVDALEALYARVLAEGTPWPEAAEMTTEGALRSHVLRLHGRLFDTMVVREIAAGQRHVVEMVGRETCRQETRLLKEETERLRTGHAALAAELDSVLASRSWRYTRPLRTAMAAMRRWRSR